MYDLKSNLILQECLQAIEVEVEKIRKKIEALPAHHEISWKHTKGQVDSIVLKCFESRANAARIDLNVE